MKGLLRYYLGHDYLVVIGLLSLLALFSARYLLLRDRDPYQPIVDLTQTRAAPAEPASLQFVPDDELERDMQSRTERTVRDLNEDLATLLAQKQYAVLRDELLQRAAQAVTDGDKPKLGHILSLLGQVSIAEQDLDAAEVYLMEALDVFNKLDDQVGAAQVYMQLGRTHLKAREVARTAGNAYDRLLVGRWQLSEGQYALAEQNFKRVIEDSLSVNRFGTAAGAFYSLVRLYSDNNDSFQAEEAASEAARLYAASGQLRRARSTVEQLRRSGVAAWRLFDIEREIDSNYAEFKRSVEQIERAKDYRQLYNHYRSRGDDARAWSLRLLASKSLRNVSKRAMFRRQPDALALLYVSNDDIARARRYFDRAQRTFDAEGLEALSSQTKKLKGQIF